MREITTFADTILISHTSTLFVGTSPVVPKPRRLAIRPAICLLQQANSKPFKILSGCTVPEMSGLSNWEFHSSGRDCISWAAPWHGHPRDIGRLGWSSFCFLFQSDDTLLWKWASIPFPLFSQVAQGNSHGLPATWTSWGFISCRKTPATILSSLPRSRKNLRDLFIKSCTARKLNCLHR